MANAECARTREVVKVLETLVDSLKELPMLGDCDPRLAVAFEVALHGDDAELDAYQARIYEMLVLAAERRANANADRDRLEFRAPLPPCAEG
jgi:hypothetical protein